MGVIARALLLKTRLHGGSDARHLHAPTKPTRSAPRARRAERRDPVLTSTLLFGLRVSLLVLGVISAGVVVPNPTFAQEGRPAQVMPSPGPLLNGRQAPLAITTPEPTPSPSPTPTPAATPTAGATPSRAEALRANRRVGTATPNTVTAATTQPAPAAEASPAATSTPGPEPSATPEPSSEASAEPSSEASAEPSPEGTTEDTSARAPRRGIPFRLIPDTLLPGGSPTPGPAASPTVTATPTASEAPSFSLIAARRLRPDPPTWPRNPPPIDAAELDAFLAARSSPLAGLGAELLNVGWRYNVDPRLLVAIAGADTGFGRVLCTDYNAWNWFWWEWCNSPFENWVQAMDEVARGLRMYYFDDGLTDVDAIADRYGPPDDPQDTLGLNRHWPGNVTRYLEELGGSRCNLTWVRTDNPCPPPRVTATPRPATTPEGEDVEGAEDAGGEQDEATVAESDVEADEVAPAEPEVEGRTSDDLAVSDPTPAQPAPAISMAELDLHAAVVAPVVVEASAAAETLAADEPPTNVGASPIERPDTTSRDLLVVALLLLLIVAGRASSLLIARPRGTEREGVLS